MTTVGWLLQNAVFVAGAAIALFWIVMIPLGLATLAWTRLRRLRQRISGN